MILVAGGTGLLGGAIVRELLAGDEPVRILTRNRANIKKFEGINVEIAIGDLCDMASVKKALEGVNTVISTANSFKGKGKSKLSTESKGIKNLIDASGHCGIENFMLVTPNVPAEFNKIDFYRYMARAEEYLKSSGLSYCIIKSSFLMDVWAQLIGVPLIKKGATTIFGQGNNPINMIAAEDVAKVTVNVLKNTKVRNRSIIAAGPENYTLRQIAEVFEQVTRKKGQKKFAYLPAMKLMAFFMRLYNPVIARQIRTAILMDSAPLKSDNIEALNHYWGKMTRLREWVRQKYSK